MNDSSLESLTRPTRRRVVTWLLCAAALGVMVLLVTLLLAKRRRDDERVVARELAEALAEADRLDPGWRLEDIEAKRPKLADGANSARCVDAVQALLPKDWPEPNVTEQVGLQDSAATEPLPEEVTTALRRELKRVAPALVEARKLEKLPQGRFSADLQTDFIGAPLSYLPRVRVCALLLSWEAWRQIEDEDLNGALATLRAVLNAGRSVGDEPTTMSQLARVAVQSEVIRPLERALASGVASEAALATFQRALAEEEARPVHLLMRRGERIWIDMYLRGLGDGSKKWSQSGGVFKENSAARNAEMAALARRCYGKLLGAENQYVEIAKRPLHEQRALLERERQKVLAQVPEPARKDLVSDPATTLTPCLLNLARLRCAAAAIAAERFRLKHGRWPNTLAELTPALLDSVPIDPFDGQPLRYSVLNDGVRIYAVRNDGADHDGEVKIVKGDLRPDAGLGFRLWDEGRRRFSKKAPMNR
jgi:hypothetical protein